MAVGLLVVIASMLLVVLGTVEAFWFDDFWLDFLSHHHLNLGLTGVLLICLMISSATFAWLKPSKALRVLVKLTLWTLLLGLFILKTLTAYVAYEKLAPKSRHIISAKVHIDTISDGVYDPVLGSAYRQVATLYDVKPAKPSNTDQALQVYNPFADQAKPLDHDRSAFLAMEGMSVLLNAHPNFTKTNLDALTTMTPASVVSMDLLIIPIDQTVSADGFDVNQWLKTRHVHANAQILSVDEVRTQVGKSSWVQFRLMLEQFRQRLRMHFYQDWDQKTHAQTQANAVTLSLMTGDRALIDRSTKDLYQLAGISHLLAISGTHVLFLAMILSTAMTWLTDRFALSIYQHLPRWQIRMAVMVIASVIYALFTGFDVPAVRTVYLLMAAWLIRYLVLPIGMVSALSWVALLMIWLDPYVLWQAGFWLSFIAVLLLIRFEQSETQINQEQHNSLWQPSLWRHRFWQMVKLQFWLFFAMLPLSILLFGKISVWGLVVNLFAIGLFGFLIVPINLLAGSVFLVIPELADRLWQFSSLILSMLHETLNFSLSHQLGAISAWLYAPFGMAGFLLCFLVVGLLILPKVLPRSLLILPVMAMVFLAFGQTKPSLKLIYLPSDSEQINQTLLIQTNGKDKHYWLILNDSGVKSLRTNHSQILTDQLYRQGVASQGLDGIIVQSSSAIFIPTIAEIAAKIPVHRYWQAGRHEQLALLRHEPCQAGLSWQADGLMLRALTGWQEIDDERVHHCELEVLSDQPLTWIGPSQASDQLTANMDLSAHTQPTKTQIIFNTSREPMIWQLWQMLCADDQTLDITQDDQYRAYWLSTTYANQGDVPKTKLPKALLLMTE